MNLDLDTQYWILKDLKERITTILESIGWLSWKALDVFEYAEFGFASALEIATNDGRIAQLWIEFKVQPRPATFPFVGLKEKLDRAETKRDRIPVLAAPSISPRMAQLCRENGWSWIDLSGNCFLDVPGAVWIERSGLKSKQFAPRPAANLATAESARVLRVLLDHKNLVRVWTQRALKDSCDPEVSLGLVNKVARYLKDQKYLEDAAGMKGFSLCDPVGLLKEWSEAYRFDRHVRIDLSTPLSPGELYKLFKARKSDDHSGNALAGLSAAQALESESPHSDKTWVFLSQDREGLFRRTSKAKPAAPSNSNLVVLIPEDSGVFYDMQVAGSERLPITSPLQTYLDLNKGGATAKDAAAAILERHLRPAWREAGLLRE